MENQSAKNQQAAAAAAAAKQQQQQQQEPAAEAPNETPNEESPEVTPEQDPVQPEEPDKEEESEAESESEEDSEVDSEDDLEELYQLLVGKKINDQGNVVDKKTGNIIGRLVEGKVRKVTGRKVGERGAVVNSKGKILGRVEPVDEESSSEEESESEDDDESEEEEVPASGDEQEEEAPVDEPKSRGISNTPKDDESESEDDNDADDVAEKVQDGADKASKKIQEGADDASEKIDDATEDASEKVGDATEDASEKVGDATEDASEKADDASEKAGDASEKAGDATEDASKKVDDATEDASEKAGDATEDADPDDISKKVGDMTDKIQEDAEDAGDKADDATKGVQDGIDDAAKEAGDASEDAGDATEDNSKKVDDVADKSRDIDTDKDISDLQVGDKPEEPLVDDESPVVKKSGKVLDTDDNVVGHVDKRLASKFAGFKVDQEGNVYDKDGEIVGTAEMIMPAEEEKPFNPNEMVDQDSPEVRKSGKVVDMEDNVIGSVDKLLAPKLAGFKVDKDGNVINNDGHIVAKADLFKVEESAAEEEEAPAEEDKPFNPNEDITEDSPEVRKSGKIVDMEDNIVGSIDKRVATKFAGLKVDKDGNVINGEGHIVAKAEMFKEEEPVEEDKPFNPNEMINEDSPEVKKSGKVLDMDDEVVGTLDKRMAAKYAGLKVDPEGNVIDGEGHIVARAEMIKKDEPAEDEDKPFNPNEAVNEDSPEVRKSGKIFDMDDELVGTLDKALGAKYAGLKVDPEGNVIDGEGHIVAKADMIKKEEPVEEDKPFNPNELVDEDSPEVKKSGKILDMDDELVGTLDKKLAAKYAGLKVDPEGNVINADGHIVAKAEMIKKEEPVEENKPFNPNEMVNEDSPEVKKSGKVVDMEDNVIGSVDKRIASKYAGCRVDPEGNVISDEGHIVGRAEMIKEEEPVEESKPFNPNPMVDEDSPEVKKSGKVLDMDDNVVGTVDKRVASKYAGCKVDPEGNVIDEEGDVVGKAEMTQAPAEEEKPFNPYGMVDENSPEVKRSGKVVDMDDNIVGSVDKLIAHKLVGFKVDNEGNIIDNEGHIAGKADMIKEEESESEEEEEKPFNPNSNVDEHSPEVTRTGNVVDENDNVVGTVDEGMAGRWAGLKVDPYGNVIDKDGQTIGKAEMKKRLTEEERKQQEEEEEYRRIANLMSQAVQQSLDKIKPVLKEITSSIEVEEAKNEKDRDEQKLVEHVKPLIEQGSQILGEAYGAIRGLDPSGNIAKEAQAKTKQRKALPEEYHLADLLSQLTGEVTTTIDNAKKKIKNMPHAKKALNPLWNILQSPLLQILSAVGLLLTGVLGLVGNILNGLGLGSIINSLLGGIGLNKILEGFGLGDALKLGKK
ncbi:hypothetical protein INT47_006103 [Mucor saturninus]|uniref:Uncharacterized protein n=1 Tax=Mucor saturninus TaxID=64648 RepID=A0A8H7RCQ2_9FUNG|nr:hypothetical protein INT47_006103 [Mucor saturninus]